VVWLDATKCEQCGRCRMVCPQGAIGAAKAGVAVNRMRCKDCGQCVAQCPTGALARGRKAKEVRG